MDDELKNHKKERKQAEGDLKAAAEKRAEEKAAFDEATKEVKATLEQIDGAISALEKGLGKSFLQTTSGADLKHLVEANPSKRERPFLK